MLKSPLKDSIGRVHDYLRISLTERCNLRCFYCMPEEGIELSPKESQMTADEIVELAQLFVAHGVNKIRLTGGEPLVRKDAPEIIDRLASLPVELLVTTNAVILDRFLDQFQRVGIKRLNVSLDSLNKERNLLIVKRDYLDRVKTNLFKALEMGFKVKLNCVLMKGVNDDEILDFIDLSKEHDLEVRFIEYMPFQGNQWSASKCVTDDEVLEQAYNFYGKDNISALALEKNFVARNYRVKGYLGSFGLISTVTKPFCSTCNRLRLTADGKLKNCLFSNSETDLLTVLRSGGDVAEALKSNLLSKHISRGGIDEMDDAHLYLAEQNRSMITIGG